MRNKNNEKLIPDNIMGRVKHFVKTAEEHDKFVDQIVENQRFPVSDEQPEHYNNNNGSLYQFSEEHGLNPWEFDIIKRIVRCRKKGNWLEDLKKTKFVIDLYIKEYKR